LTAAAAVEVRVSEKASMTEEFLRENRYALARNSDDKFHKGNLRLAVVERGRPKVPRRHAVNVTNCLSAPACSVRLRVELDKPTLSITSPLCL
jgi:hypothetical protein